MKSNQTVDLETINAKYDKIINVSVKVGHSIGQIFVVRLA